MAQSRAATEVIKVRICAVDKAELESIAEKESRTFAGQYRLVLREWLENERQQRQIRR